MKRARITAFLVFVFSSTCAYGADKARSVSVDRAIELADRPTDGFANMSPFELQVHYRLMWLLRKVEYRYEERHAASWKACLRDDKKSMYARLCAAFFLLDQDAEARDFVSAQLKSENLRYRYNAAEVVRLHSGSDTAKWRVDTLIKLLSDGSIDGSGVSDSPRGKYPHGDRDDIMFAPIDSICGSLGFAGEKNAVPALISVLERRPETGEAAFALGEIGDMRAVPILMKVLKDRSGDEDQAVTALGRLKCKDAVPILISRLGEPEPKSTFGGMHPHKNILDALLQIGDKRAVKGIEQYLKGDYPQEYKAVARRVLVQLKSADPVEALLTLLRKETYEPERSDIISDLTKYADDRVVKELGSIARTSDSAFMRREAILALRDIGDRQSLLALAALLDLKFSKDLKARWGWKGPPDFRKYFPATIEMCLKQCTGQDFGRDRSKWEHWIAKNVESQEPSDRH